MNNFQFLFLCVERILIRVRVRSLDSQHKRCQLNNGQYLLSSDWYIHYDFLFNINMTIVHILMQLNYMDGSCNPAVSDDKAQLQKKKTNIQFTGAYYTKHIGQLSDEWARHEVLWQRNIFQKRFDHKINTHLDDGIIDWHLSGSVLCVRQLSEEAHTEPSKSFPLPISFSLPLYTIGHVIYFLVYGLLFVIAINLKRKKNMKTILCSYGHQLINEINVRNWHVSCACELVSSPVLNTLNFFLGISIQFLKCSNGIAVKTIYLCIQMFSVF